MAIPKPCTGFISNHPLWKGEPSYTCKGCINRDPIDPKVKEFILNKDPEKVNCKNYWPAEEEK